MTTKTNATLADNVESIKSTIASVTADLEQLRLEHAQLLEDYAKGHLGVDVDRLGELTDKLIPRREAYLEQLQKDTLPRAEHAVRQAELDALAVNGRGGIAAHRKAYAEKVQAAEKDLAAAVAAIREAGQEWNEYLAPAVQASKEATKHRRAFGEDDDSTVRHLAAGWGRNIESLGIEVNGTEYRPASIERDLRYAIRESDSYLAGLVREANDARTISEGQRVQALDRRG